MLKYVRSMDEESDSFAKKTFTMTYYLSRRKRKDFIQFKASLDERS
jgi:hypothetical protein